MVKFILDELIVPKRTSLSTFFLKEFVTVKLHVKVIAGTFHVMCFFTRRRNK